MRKGLAVVIEGKAAVLPGISNKEGVAREERAVAVPRMRNGKAAAFEGTAPWN
jgi:hypothetical protein